MRILIILTLALVISACATPPVPSTEAGQVAEAEQLVRSSLTERIMDNLQKYYREQISSMLVGQGVSAEEAAQIVDTAMQQVIEAKEQRLVENLVPIYRRFYTADEIHQLLSFYQTDVARKSMQVSSQIAAESQQFVRLWNEDFGEELLKRVDAKVKGNP